MRGVAAAKCVSELISEHCQARVARACCSMRQRAARCKCVSNVRGARHGAAHGGHVFAICGAAKHATA
eukprot:4527245-Lingulodinium_polyedra.AAC.1